MHGWGIAKCTVRAEDVDGVSSRKTNRGGLSDFMAQVVMYNCTVSLAWPDRYFFHQLVK